MIFVDTSAWVALYAPKDFNHLAAKQFHKTVRDRFVTNDYVIDETLTVLKSRVNGQIALEVGVELFAGELVQIEWVSSADVQDAWEVFQRFRDKAWSFTDCVSHVMMRRLSVGAAFAFDEHFRQFGTVAVVP